MRFQYQNLKFLKTLPENSLDLWTLKSMVLKEITDREFMYLLMLYRFPHWGLKELARWDNISIEGVRLHLLNVVLRFLLSKRGREMRRAVLEERSKAKDKLREIIDDVDINTLTTHKILNLAFQTGYELVSLSSLISEVREERKRALTEELSGV